ncbi:MAG: hypothetical protein KC910_28710, partial [Candidatus Eremiobacteraeota bacterium]|nr:hypothetical protein [Candidatus Eremiobacteraeota bacterium]
DREVFVQAVALANSSNGNGSGDVLSHLHATPPDPTTHAANLRATLDRLAFPNAGMPAPNFNFDPNRFLDSGDRVRVKYRREFSL